MKKFLSIGNFKTAYDFPEMDKKPLKGCSRPRLRKEDISQPVDFRHVEGYNKEKDLRKGSISACTSPTQLGEFFKNPNINRLSDSSSNDGPCSLGYGVENRFSGERYQQFQEDCSDSSYFTNRDSFGESNDSNNALRPTIKSFSGSLRNLTFLQFGKQSGCTINNGTIERRSNGKLKDSQPATNKRMSLGSLLSGSRNSFNPSSDNHPPPSPIYESIPSGRSTFRRRSSSFNGGADFGHLRPPDDNSHEVVLSAPIISNGNPRSSVFSWMKKPKYSNRPEEAEEPPLSPTYDELPPPLPHEEYEYESRQSYGASSLPLPLSPSYSDLPPPPLLPEDLEETLGLRRGFKGPPLTLKKNQKSEDSADDLPTPPPSPLSPPEYSKTDTIKRRPQPQPSPPVPASLPTQELGKGSPILNRNVPGWRAKVVKVSAPTLPPASAPFIRPNYKEGSPLTPESWPLEPNFPYIEHAYEGDFRRM
jgi:hypothetical protein